MAGASGVSGSHVPMVDDAGAVTTAGYTCACCGETHDGLPPAIAFDAPAFWEPEMAGLPGHLLTSDSCVIPEVGFFVRAVLRIPVLDSDQDFEWGVWISQSEANFRRIEAADRHRWRRRPPPTFGWLSSDLPGYGESCLEVTTMLHDQGRVFRPLVSVEPGPHPLSVEQREGITIERVLELAHLATGD
jgi:hypothetical protein